MVIENPLINALAKQSGISVLEACDMKAMNDHMLDSKGRLQPVESDFLQAVHHKQMQFFCHQHGIYSVPSVELIDYLSDLIGNKDKCIEIGAGNGVYGRALGIPMFDNYMQHPKNERKFGHVSKMYAQAGQPVVNYGGDVQEMDGLDAVIKYRPQTVLMSWVTHKYNRAKHELGGNMYGIDMMKMAKRFSVKRIILIGNEAVHANSPLMDLPCDVRALPEILFSRASRPELDRIYIWDVSNE